MLVAHNVQKGEWACQVPFFPPYQTHEVKQNSPATWDYRVGGWVGGGAGKAFPFQFCTRVRGLRYC